MEEGYISLFVKQKKYFNLIEILDEFENSIYMA
jgi:hypothetical protein